MGSGTRSEMPLSCGREASSSCIDCIQLPQGLIGEIHPDFCQSTVSFGLCSRPRGKSGASTGTVLDKSKCSIGLSTVPPSGPYVEHLQDGGTGQLEVLSNKY